MGILRGAFVLVLACSAFGAAWTDRSEYDLVLTIRAEATPQKRLTLLDQWKIKYPQSELRQVRRELYLAAYQELADNNHMLDVAKEMVAEQPDNFVGAYWCTLLIPSAKNPSAELWALGQKAAARLMSGTRPEAVPEVEWATQKDSVELLGRRLKAWILWQTGDYPAAETEFQAYLAKNPNNAEMTAWYGMALAAEKQPEKTSRALWQLARAATIKDDQALPEATRRQVGELVDRMYASFHGDSEGLEQMRTMAASSAAPPAEFKIETAAAIAARKADAEMLRSNPMLATWLGMRKQLDSPDGDKYFAETLRPSRLPRLKGTVIRCSPAKKPTEIVLGMSNAVTEEVVLKVATAFAREADPGTEIEFEGVADSFTKAPFQLTVMAEKDKITGWPEVVPVKKGR
jgi:tetratricopeptide (TPR) repeat protein